MVWGEKGCPQERNLRDIHSENTMFCLLSVFCVFFCLHITEYEQIRGGGAKFSWAQGRKIPKYGPEYMHFFNYIFNHLKDKYVKDIQVEIKLI
jgi:hypothetical protein